MGARARFCVDLSNHHLDVYQIRSDELKSDDVVRSGSSASVCYLASSDS